MNALTWRHFLQAGSPSADNTFCGCNHWCAPLVQGHHYRLDAAGCAILRALSARPVCETLQAAYRNSAGSELTGSYGLASERDSEPRSGDHRTFTARAHRCNATRDADRFRRRRRDAPWLDAAEAPSKATQRRDAVNGASGQPRQPCWAISFRQYARQIRSADAASWSGKLKGLKGAVTARSAYDRIKVAVNIPTDSPAGGARNSDRSLPYLLAIGCTQPSSTTRIRRRAAT